MKLAGILFFILVISFNAEAQFGSILKKKNKEAEQREVSDTTNLPQTNSKDEKTKSGGIFQKVVGKIAKVAGNTAMAAGGGIATIDNLSEADIIASVGTNIYSKDLGLMFTDFLGNEWINNGDFTMLQIASKDAFKFYKYAGSVKVNGKDLKHVSMGIYTATENPGSVNKKITFEKNGVVEGSFDVPLPDKNVKLLSINGQSKDVKVDFTKDVTLELANFSATPESLIRIDVITTQIGIRTLSLVAYVKPASKITIPAAAFRNIENTNNFNFRNCYLSVSDQLMVKAMNITGKIPQTQMVITGSNDGKWIEVTASKENEKGLKFTSGNARVVKGNAAYSKPLSFAKNTAVSSFYTYATTYSYGVETNRWMQTETTKTIDFPEPSNEYLDAMLQNLYTKLTAVYTDVTGNKVLPVATVPSLPCYANTQKFMRGEVNNDENFLKAYKNLEPTKTFTSVSNRYYGEGQMLKEANADALLKVSLICQLSWDKKPAMTPYLEVELIGAANGDFRSFVGNTKYFTMNIKGSDYELKKKDAVEFDKVFQVDEFVKQFRNALTDLKNKEAGIKDYEEVWNLQK